MPTVRNDKRGRQLRRPPEFRQPRWRQKSACLVVGCGKRVLNELAVVARQLRRPKLEGQLVADIEAAATDVCFRGNSGHHLGNVKRLLVT